MIIDPAGNHKSIEHKYGDGTDYKRVYGEDPDRPGYYLPRVVGYTKYYSDGSTQMEMEWFNTPENKIKRQHEWSPDGKRVYQYDDFGTFSIEKYYYNDDGNTQKSEIKLTAGVITHDKCWVNGVQSERNDEHGPISTTLCTDFHYTKFWPPSTMIEFTTANDATSIPVPQTPSQTDTTPPVITLYGNHTMMIPYNGTYTEPGATCADDVDGAILLDIIGTVDTSTPGNHTITYSCQDSASNAAAVYRTVTVMSETAQSQSDAVSDATRPIITLNGASQVNLDVGDTYIDAGATCTDDVDGAITASDDSTNVNTNTAGNHIITYQCVDTSGNAAIPVHRTVTVAEPQTPTTIDAALIATVQSYADETQHGADHVNRWYRVLAAFDAITPMSVSEAQDMSEKYSAARWNPIVSELQKPAASQAVIDDVISYAAETQHGADHVNRWYRVLAAFDAITPMTVSEAQEMADKYSPSRWNPVVTALTAQSQG